MACAQPQHAHAVLTARPGVTLRSACGLLCARRSGRPSFVDFSAVTDGRAATAGIDHQQADQLGHFIHTFLKHC
jgi:hypothetical protein